MKYEVFGCATVACGMTVEADSERNAIKIANEEFGSLMNYVGMGGADKLMGVSSSEDDRFVCPDSDVEFDIAVPKEEGEPDEKRC